MDAGWMWSSIQALSNICYIGFDDFVLMCDNARAHTTRTVIQNLEALGIETMDRPSMMSSRLNPIELLRDMLN